MSGADLVFGALAEPARREIVRILAFEGPQSATRLAERLPFTRQATVKHLRTLVSAGLAAPQRRGREVDFRLTPEPLADAAAWIAQVGAEWDVRLERLRRLLEQPPG